MLWSVRACASGDTTGDVSHDAYRNLALPEGKPATLGGRITGAPRGENPLGAIPQRPTLPKRSIDAPCRSWTRTGSSTGHLSMIPGHPHGACSMTRKRSTSFLMRRIRSLDPHPWARRHSAYQRSIQFERGTENPVLLDEPGLLRFLFRAYEGASVKLPPARCDLQHG